MRINLGFASLGQKYLDDNVLKTIAWVQAKSVVVPEAFRDFFMKDLTLNLFCTIKYIYANLE